uniref:Uncharacterized protein n=1 Tax=Anguilla anguilla TaxID=7936 RepID=A0A0E9W321_ANGAN
MVCSFFKEKIVFVLFLFFVFLMGKISRRPLTFLLLVFSYCLIFNIK